MVALEVRRGARVGPIKPIRGSDGLEDPTKKPPLHLLKARLSLNGGDVCQSEACRD